MHISSSINPITAIWVGLEKSFPPAGGIDVGVQLRMTLSYYNQITLLSHRRSTTVSLETFTFIHESLQSVFQWDHVKIPGESRNSQSCAWKFPSRGQPNPGRTRDKIIRWELGTMSKIYLRGTTLGTRPKCFPLPPLQEVVCPRKCL